ncbi:MAG: hypothetical protein HYR94_12395 [Chloroflexi bacterium]|nr:hypothetical protein [Chloroflexota bacterium]
MYSNFIRRSLQLGGAFGLVLAGLLLSLFSVSPAYAGGVVGDGTSASCTEAAFDAKLVGGGTITFNCGGAKTITFTTLKQIADNTTLDGSGLITLSGSNAALFQIFSGKTFSLQNITLTNGQSSQGGAIQNFGITSIINSQLTNNRSSNQGGAIYNQGTLTMTNTTLSNNKAANTGAGIYHDGPSLSVNNSL